MFKYEIIETNKRIVFHKRYMPPFGKITYLEQGHIDFTNLRGSSANKNLFEIPRKAQRELNSKGEASFVVFTKTIVVLRRTK